MALGAIAAGWRTRFDPLVVGVTGSIAKTSTKEAIAAVLGDDLPDAPQRGQPEQRDRAAADAPAARPGPPRRRARDGHVRRRRDRRPRPAGPAEDRRRHRGPRRAPEPDGLARRDRAGEGRARRGAAVRRRRGAQPGRPARPPDGRPNRGAGPDLRPRPRRRRRAPRTSPRPGFDGMRFTLRLPAGPRRPPDPRCRRASPGSASCPSTTRSPAPRSGTRRASSRPVIVHALAGGWSAAHRGQVVRLGRVTLIDDTLQRLAAVGDGGARPPRRPARPARSPSSARCSSSGKGAATGHREVGHRGRGDVSTCWSSSAPGASRDRRRREGRRASTRRGSSRPATARPRSTSCASGLRDGDVVLVKASRGVELDLLVDALRGRARPEPAERDRDERRADPGPPARVRGRS